MHTAIRSFALLPLVALLAAGCGGGDTASSAATGAAGRSESGAAASISEADLAAYERGFQQEIEAVRSAQKSAAEATDAEARGRALQAQWDTATIPLGAEASGLGEERYRAVRTTVHDLLRTLDFQGRIDGPLSMDLERADDATRTRLSRDAFADLPAESANTLRAALPRLTPAWVEYVTLTAAAG